MNRVLRTTGQRGWSMIELVSVLAVIGLLTSMAWPAFDGLMARLSLRSASMTVIQTLRTARSRAMAEGRAYAVMFDGGGTSYQVTGGAEIDRVPLPPRVTFGAPADVLGPPSSPTTPPPASGVTFHQAHVIFLPDGTLSPGPGTVYLTGRGAGTEATMAISVTIAGHPRRYAWEGGQWRAL
ncbi:MAG TPA: GspH/FimT family pseudopilin [Nitrospiria bacterium]|nr:GspH/FimT family pseudopilin [Nitrospiria bacterium]